MAKEKPKPVEESLGSDATPGQEIMDVRMRGPADKVRRQLGLEADGKSGLPAPRQSVEATTSEQKEEFRRLLQNPKYVAVVRRTDPRKFKGSKCNIEVDRLDLPVSLQSIIDIVSKNYGGGEYRIAILNPDTNTTLAADRFVVEGDPIMETDEDLEREIFGDTPPETPSPIDEVNKVTDQTIEQTAKMIQLEHAKETLDQLRGRKGARTESRDPKVEILERELAELRKSITQRDAETRHQEQLRAMEDRHAKDMAELRQLLKDQQKPQGENELVKIMVANQKSSDEKFSKLLEQMQNDRLTAMLNEIKELKSAKTGGDFEKQIELFKTFADLAGIDLPGRGGDDGDDKEWYEKLIDRIPEILETVKGKGGERGVTKEDILKEVDKLADEAIAKKTTAGRLPPPPTAPAKLPQPPATPPQGSPSASIPADLSAPPAPGGPSAASVPPPLTADQELQLRCASVLTMLDRESTFRAKVFDWSYEAWKQLPEDMLEELAASSELSAGLSVFDKVVPSPALDGLKKRFLSDEKAKAWANRGFQEIKDWIAKAKLDPNFDPLGEEEGEEEGEGQ